MEMLFEFSQNWYIVFFSFAILWIILVIYRKSYRKKKEVKEQFTFALIGLIITFILENYAVSEDLWHYIPGDWPIILWPTYFVVVLFGYQLLKLIEKYF